MESKISYICKIKLFFVIVLFNQAAYAQNLSFGFQTGIGSYKMEDLKEIDASVLNILPFEAKITSDYPPYIYYKPSVLLSFKNTSFGLQVSINSSGSRISSKDYSGEYTFDNIVRAIMTNLVFDVTIISISEKSKIAFLTESGIIFSELRSNETLLINEEVIENESYFFKSKNFHLSPGFKLKYELNQYFDIELNSLYCIQFGENELKNKDTSRQIYDQDYAKSEWGGIRVGLSFVINLPTNEN
ncbi:MAG: hypothetical protein K9H49_04050 [Bacteroidales bacterium]|nr:hypothetical protein [Bacteroidales bacterium]MCF8390084.1 hypothetical protein [Bacteroidales bacterium]